MVKADFEGGGSPDLHKRSAEGRGYPRNRPKGCLDDARGRAPNLKDSSVELGVWLGGVVRDDFLGGGCFFRETEKQRASFAR